MGIEVRQEGKVSGVEETRRIVRHVVTIAREVILQREVSMEALMQGLHAEEGGHRRSGGAGPFAMPVQGGNVVGARLRGALANVVTLYGSLVVEEAAGEFQFGVGDGARRVGERDEGLPDVVWEGKAPDNRNCGCGGDGFQCRARGIDTLQGTGARNGVRFGYPHSSRTDAGGVVSPLHSGHRRDQFVEPCGADGKIAVEPAEVLQGLMEASSEPEAIMLASAQHGLEVTEQTSGSWQSDGH
jgi:hypothetical protein